MSVIVAPGVAAPCASCTVPATEAVVICAAEGSATASDTTTAAAVRRRRGAMSSSRNGTDLQNRRPENSTNPRARFTGLSRVRYRAPVPVSGLSALPQFLERHVYVDHRARQRRAA